MTLKPTDLLILDIFAARLITERSRRNSPIIRLSSLCISSGFIILTSASGRFVPGALLRWPSPKGDTHVFFVEIPPLAARCTFAVRVCAVARDFSTGECQCLYLLWSFSAN